MALTSKKICKLDAICAKLKQSKQDEEKEEESNDDRPGLPDSVFESPTNLSMKCYNNNIIGKADLNTIEHEIHGNGLDLSKKSYASLNGNKADDDDTNDDKQNEPLDFTGRSRSIERNNKSESELTEVKPVGSSRRKRGIPRSISQVRDLHDQDESKHEVEDINENKRFSPDGSYNGGRESVSSCKRLSESGDYSNLNDESSSSALNHSKTSNHSKESSKSRHSSELDISDSYSTPLDLSINRSSKYDEDNNDDDDDDSINGYLSSDEDGINNTVEDDDDDDFFHPDRNLVIDEGKSVSQFSECSTESSVNLKDGKNIGNDQAAHLKDYAESTMNELISMYGFGGLGSHQNDLSKHVPIKNFTSILQFAHREQPSSMGSVGGASLSNHPMSSGDEESRDGSQPMKRLYANAGAGASGKTQGGSKVQNDRFTTSSSFINAVYNTSSGPVQNQLSPGLPNYSKYLKRYNNGSECGGQHCKDLGYREHYHCIDCSFQVFIKKEEMVRHYKWHRKREESLQHGFLRFSPVDNCSKRFGSCTHNGKQTHYHCLQNGCDKVYISTSDVQMHANYHRKDSAIMSEGFQRFRATEDCGTMSCAFYGQRTTHFHCLRPECKFTFKNKADMEKHKSYHQKDEVLGRDGFKKFMKYEHCMYSRCRYSKVSNHIHCIRNGCDYVLHSTAQLYSHKRKHERRDFESAYKHYRDTSQGSPQSGHPGEKLILPRPDMSQLQQLASMSGNQLAHTFANISNMSSSLKRQLDWDQPEPLELKKPKVEPDSDFESSLQSAPSARSTPDERDSVKMETEEQSMDENLSSCQDDSKDSSPDFKPHFGQVFKDGDGLNLSGSLNLPIPKFLIKSEPSTPTSVSSNSSISNLKNIQPKPIEMSSKAESMFSVFGSLAGSMPSTLTGSLLAMNPGTMLTVPSTFPGPSTALQPPKSVYTERREKDDSWKTYLVRYTANDPCNPHCQYLYKDHYHCKMQGCLVLFKSKDGVREHARFHELQERITPIAYQTYEDVEACPQDCQYSRKEKHFHCIWTGCTHVVPYKGPTFGRLEHYRIHEYARAAAGKSYPRTGKGMPSIEDSSMRRRGRPPKYPKIDIPKIPKVELTDEEIRQSHLIVEEPEETSQMKVINGFRVFTPEDPCPDEICSFYGKLHYHCARPRCFTITDRIDVLNLHAKDFHSFVKILEGYEFFDRNVSCRRNHCTNKLTNRHFHCARPKCDYSFIRHSTMAQHEKKHQYIPSATSFHFTTKDVPISPKTFQRDSPLNSTAASIVSQSPSPVGVATSVITSAGAFLPMKQTTSTGNHIYISQPGTMSPGPVILTQQPVTLSGIPIGLTQSPIHVSTVPLPINTIQALPASITAPQLLTGLPTPIVTVGGAPITVGNLDNSADSPSIPLTVLLQRGVNQIPQPSWMDLKAKMHYAISQNCGRPFCKLKKKDHFHCYDCNQAFSDPARLRSHIGKHGLKLKRAEQTLVHNVIAPKVPIQNLNAVNMSNSYTAINSNNNNKHVDEDLDPDEAQCLSNKAEEEDESEVEDTKSSSLNLNPSAFSEMISKAQEQNQMSSAAESDDENSLHIDVDDSGNLSDSNDQKADVSSRSGRKIIKTKKEGFVNSGEINLSKKNQSALPNNVNTKQSPKKSATKVAAAGSRGLRDDSIPEGYSRWRYNEECKYPKCAYRHSVTHFHCVRDDCGYGFSDRSRLVQHTLRHERIDSITGGELQQFRINQDCEMADCEYNKKMSHFHCKRCVYSCTDSSKVLTHRKYHAKMDNISDQGFEKYFAVDDCNVNLCPYARKQNHFHCVEESCRAAVLGPIQMASHKVKHGSMVKLQILENS